MGEPEPLIKEAFVYIVRKEMPDKKMVLYTDFVCPLTLVQTIDVSGKKVRFNHKWCGTWISTETKLLILRFRGDGNDEKEKYTHTTSFSIHLTRFMRNAHISQTTTTTVARCCCSMSRPCLSSATPNKKQQRDQTEQQEQKMQHDRLVFDDALGC